MSTFYFIIAGLLLISVLLGLVRIVKGPTPADRLLAIQLLGTTAVAILVVLAEPMTLPALRDVALVFALLAVIATVAFVKISPAIRSLKVTTPTSTLEPEAKDAGDVH